MSVSAIGKIDSAIHAWDLYAEGKYDEVLSQYHSENESLNDLILLAQIELGRPTRSPTNTLFASLAESMLLSHKKDFLGASVGLGRWLLEKSYYSPRVIERFVEATSRTQNYSLQLAVLRRFLDIKAYHSIILRPLFLASYELGKYKEAIAIFEKFRSVLADAPTTQKYALSLLHIERYEDAEQILLGEYRRITGQPYELNYEKARERYKPLISKIPELEKRRNESPRTAMELGMAYLFSHRYDEALKVFERVLRSTQKN